MRYSLKEVFNSPLKELAKFTSRRETSSKFYFFINNFEVLKDEHTVIGVKFDLGGTLVLYLMTKQTFKTIYKS